jgi:hypothetical protein
MSKSGHVVKTVRLEEEFRDQIELGQVYLTVSEVFMWVKFHSLLPSHLNEKLRVLCMVIGTVDCIHPMLISST